MSSWSYSAYSSAIQCLRKYKLCYVDKLVPEGPESGDLVFGSALHSAINAVLTGEDGAGTFELYWSSYQNKEVEYGRFKWAELAKIGAEFIRKFVKMHASKYELRFAESRLYSSYRGILLEGTLDYYGLYSGRHALRDFKTSARNYDAEKADCALQLYLYAYLAIKNNIGVPETLGYTVFNKATGSIQDLTWDFKEEAMIKALDDMVDYCSNVDSRQTFPRNLNSCLDYNRKCQYYDICHKESK